MDDVIKILRNIETTKIDVILHDLEDLKSGEFSNTPEVVENFDQDEIYRLIQLNETLAKHVEDDENVIQKLQGDIVYLKKNANIQTIIETVEELLSENSLSIDTKGNLVLPREYRNLLIKKIKTISNV